MNGSIRTQRRDAYPVHGCQGRLPGAVAFKLRHKSMMKNTGEMLLLLAGGEGLALLSVLEGSRFP